MQTHGTTRAADDTPHKETDMQTYVAPHTRAGAAIQRQLAWLLVFLLALALFPVRPTYAASAIVVDTTADNGSLTACTAAPDDCSLRGAITKANAVSGTDTITFDSSVFSTPQSILLSSTLPSITSTIIINGPGEALLTVDGASTYRVFYAGAGSDLTLANLTVANGSVTGNGGGIYATGAAFTATNVTFSGNRSTGNGGAMFITASSTATLTGSTLSGNSAVFGGGLYSQGTLAVTHSTLSGNSTSSNGGGIYMQNGMTTLTDSTLDGNWGKIGGGTMVVGGDLIIGGSTFSHNSTTGGAGGGLVAQGSTVSLTVFNSTFSGNTSVGQAGGIQISASTPSATLTNSTIAGNAAATNGGGINAAGALTLNNSIIAGNTGSNQCNHASKPFAAQNSLIEDGTCGITSGVNGNLTGDPLLGALEDYGGPTLTMALLDGSPAIDAGNNALAVDASGNPLATDQRGPGFVRIAGGVVNMGAYEMTPTL